MARKPTRTRDHVGLCDEPYTADEIEFMNAVEAFKRRWGVLAPTCRDVLAVARELGYVRVDRPEPLEQTDDR